MITADVNVKLVLLLWLLLMLCFGVAAVVVVVVLLLMLCFGVAAFVVVVVADVNVKLTGVNSSPGCGRGLVARP